MRRAFFSLAAGCLAACAAVPDSTGHAESEATSASPVHENHPYFWAETSFQDFLVTAKQPRQFVTSYTFEGSQALAARLQAWTDRIHGEVSRDVRARTGSPLVAPKPTILVVQAAEPNAWVTGVNACLVDDVDLSRVGAPDRPASTADVAVLERDGISVLQFNFQSGPPRCAEATNWNDDDLGIAFVNAAGGACKLRRAEGGRVEAFGEQCALKSGAQASSARRLAYLATSPYVTFTTAMLARLPDERALVGILAHELGHYYRAHAVSEPLMARYNYWYEQKDPPDPETPDPAADSASLQATFRRVMSVPMPRVPGQKLSYRLTLPLLDTLATELARVDEPGFACGAAVAMLREDWRFEFGFVGAPHVSEGARARYLAFEEELLACAPDVQVTEEIADGALSLSAIRSGLHRYRQRLGGQELHLAAGTLAELLTSMQALAAPLDAEAEAFLAAVESRRLGRYTVEQEADEMSLEYFTRVGFEAKERTDMELETVRPIAAEDPEAFAAADGVDFATCERWYRAGFRSENGPIFVPLGNLHSPHHGYCYRLFNLVQEQRAHGYRASGAPLRFDQPWETLRLVAERATRSTPVRPASFVEPSSGLIIDRR
jgi:Zn-dependent protease with chaperone function